MVYLMEVTAALVALVLVTGVLALAVVGKPVPPEVAIALTAAISYLFGATATRPGPPVGKDDPK